MPTDAGLFNAQRRSETSEIIRYPLMQTLRLIVGCSLMVLSPLTALGAPKPGFAEVTRLRPNIEHGKELFQSCASCHGADGSGSRTIGTPGIAGQHFRVLAKQLVDYQADRRYDIRMEQIARRHNLAEAQAIADVAAYVSQLDWKQSGGIGDGEFAAHGAGVYLERCQSCHGARGGGDPDRLAPRLAGQQYGYLLREMHDAVEGRRPNFSLKHIRLLQQLDHDDFVGLADFLSRMDPAQVAPQARTTP